MITTRKIVYYREFTNKLQMYAKNPYNSYQVDNRYESRRTKKSLKIMKYVKCVRVTPYITAYSSDQDQKN